MLKHVVVHEIKPVSIRHEQLSQAAPVEFARPFPRIQRALRPLVRQGRIHGHIGNKPTLAQKPAAPRGIGGQMVIARPPDVLGADANSGEETAGGHNAALRRRDEAVIVELVRAREQISVCRGLQFLQCRAIGLPMQVRKRFRADDVPPVQVRARGHILLRPDARVEPRHCVLFARGNLHLGNVRLARAFDVVRHETIGLYPALHTVPLAPVQKRLEERFHTPCVKKGIHVIADLRGKAAHVPPQSG